jgi:hypothetical protein
MEKSSRFAVPGANSAPTNRSRSFSWNPVLQDEIRRAAIYGQESHSKEIERELIDELGRSQL